MRNDEPIGIVAKIAWSFNGWKSVGLREFELRNRYSYSFVKKVGYGHEFWNFNEEFDPEFYYGHLEVGKKSINKLKGKKGLIIFISKNPVENEWYFVGFYGNGEYLKDGYHTQKKIVHLLPKKIIEHLKNVLETTNTVITQKKEDIKIKDYIRRVLASVGKESFIANLRGEKRLSTVFDEDAYVKISEGDIGSVKTLRGRWSFIYIGQNEKAKPKNIRDLLLRVKHRHENLLKNPYLDRNKKEKIKVIIEKIDKVLELYFGEYYDRSVKTFGNMDKECYETLESYFQSKGYQFPNYVIAQFYTALKTKGFVILSGLSGSGKTKIALEFAKLLGDDTYIFLSVRPDWRDSKPLLGYYNPLDKRYYKTFLLELILRAIEDYKQNKEKATPYFIILDEMNLAHVEYYFADFLSVLESGRDKDGFTRESIKLHDEDKVVEKQGIPKEIKLPPNLYIIGTVNIDETTYMFSPKVLDRAFTIEFHDVDLNNYPPEMDPTNVDFSNLRDLIIDDLRNNGNFLTYADKEIAKEAVQELRSLQYWQILQNLKKMLEPYDMHFGYRVVDEIALFFKNAKESQEKRLISFESDDEIFDLALLMKILPKFHGNRKKLEEPLKEILRICLKEEENLDELNSENSLEDVIKILQNWETEKQRFKFQHTAKKVLRMLRQLFEIGFASFG